MRESCAAYPACKRSLQSTDFILQVLSLLAQRAFKRPRAHGLYRVANAIDIALQPVAHDRKICRQRAVVVDEEDIGEAFRGVAPDVLSYDFATDRAPNVVDAVLTTDFFGVVQRHGTVAVCDDEDMFLWKILFAATSVGPMMLATLSYERS